MLPRERQCAQCSDLRALVDDFQQPGRCWQSCKRRRLCSLVDAGLIVLWPWAGGRPALEDLTTAQDKLVDGAIRADTLAQLVQFPATANEFVGLAKLLHRELFREAQPSIAGRFRTRDEIAEFGGAGVNKIEGAPSEQIHGRLMALHYDVASSGMDLPTRLAMFLERFFRIHPFVDGNGRIGRILVRLLCEARSDRTMTAFRRDGQSRRRYLRALEYAHKRAPGTYDGRPCNPYGHLARWLAEHMIAKPPSDLQDLPPLDWDIEVDDWEPMFTDSLDDFDLDDE